MTSTHLSTLRATSEMDSRSPSGEFVWSTKIALPPMVLMPASKLMRVRRLAFSNISTICLAWRALRYSRGLRLTSCPSLRMARTSGAERSAMEHMSSPAMRAAAARMSGSRSTGIAVCRVLVATRVSSYGWGCGRGCSLRCLLSQNLVECRYCLVDVFAFQNVRRQEAKYGIAGAVDENAAFQHFGYRELGKVGRVEFGGQHQSL